MAGLIRRINKNAVNKLGNIFTKIIGTFLGFEKGQFVVAHGKHEITVPLKICTSRVWVSVDASIIDGCAQAPVNKIGYRILNKRSQRGRSNCWEKEHKKKKEEEDKKKEK